MWPQVQPYDEEQHHLTVARGCDDAGLARLRARFGPLLPLRGKISEAVLLERDATGAVHELARFAFAEGDERKDQTSDHRGADLVAGLRDRADGDLDADAVLRLTRGDSA